MAVIWANWLDWLQSAGWSDDSRLVTQSLSLSLSHTHTHTCTHTHAVMSKLWSKGQQPCVLEDKLNTRVNDCQTERMQQRRSRERAQIQLHSSFVTLWECISFINVIATFSVKNDNLVEAIRSHGAQRPVLMRQNVNSGVPVRVGSVVWIDMRFGLWHGQVALLMIFAATSRLRGNVCVWSVLEQNEHCDNLLYLSFRDW